MFMYNYWSGRTLTGKEWDLQLFLNETYTLQDIKKEKDKKTGRSIKSTNYGFILVLSISN